MTADKDIDIFLDEDPEEVAREEAEWEALASSPESQRFLDKMVAELKREEGEGRLLDFDPGDPER